MGLPRLAKLGRYELVLELGRGGMAELYLALSRNRELDWEKPLALKRILPHLAEDPQFVDMFLNEGRIAARLSHPNICQVFDIERSDGELFLVMEYLDGVSWDVLVAALPPGEASLRASAGVLAQACDGLHHAHACRGLDGHATPIVHRDVSPQNLFVTVAGQCKVLDFGVSKMIERGPRTRTGVLKGKLPYMSPEQIQGDPIDARSDVFALGVVLWEALAKESLFDRDTDFQIWKAITEADIPPLAPRGYPTEVDEVIRCALSRDRDRRFSSARALGEAIRHASGAAGGPLDTSGIAAVLHDRCGARLADHARAVSDAMRGRRARATAEPSTRATDVTDRDGASTVSLREAAPDGGSTVSLESADRDGGSTVDLRRAPVAPAPRRRWPALVAVPASLAVALIAWRVLRSPDSPSDPDRVAIGSPSPSIVVAPPSPSPSPSPSPPPSPSPSPPLSPPPSPSPSPPPSPSTGRKHHTLALSPSPSPPLPGGNESHLSVGAVDPGRYSINSDPPATIYIDNVRIGGTPLSGHELAAGTHVIRAVLADGQNRAFTIRIPSGGEATSGTLTWDGKEPYNMGL